MNKPIKPFVPSLLNLIMIGAGIVSAFVLAAQAPKLKKSLEYNYKSRQIDTLETKQDPKPYSATPVAKSTRTQPSLLNSALNSSNQDAVKK